MTEKDPDFDSMKEPLVDGISIQPSQSSGKIDPTSCKQAQAGGTNPPPLASTQQATGAAWAGGISGLLLGGPIGAILLAWGGMHLAKANKGDVGNFCRKAGDFMHRVGNTIKKEWNEARSTNSDENEEPRYLS
jgi:hypothetical protein